MKAWELLDKSEKWTKGAEAKDSKGISVIPTNENATCWCAYGAIKKCYPDYSNYVPIFNKISPVIGYLAIAHWNDAPERTYEEVYQLLKKLDI